MRLSVIPLLALAVSPATAIFAVPGSNAGPAATTSAAVSSVVESSALTLTAAPPTSFVTSVVLPPNGTVPTNSTRTSKSRKPHTEPIPIFTSRCDCPNIATVAYPCWATDSLQRCEFEELHSFICWTSAAFGCPTPTRSCRSLYKPTPITGKHPCEIGPGNPPEATATPTLTLTATLPSNTTVTATGVVPGPTA